MLRRPYHEQPAAFAFTPANLEWANGQIAKYPEGSYREEPLAPEVFARVATFAEIGAERDNRVSVNAVDEAVIAHGSRRNR